MDTIESLRAIWCEVLELDTVGDGDNFFDLGGDSLLGLEVSMLARERGLAMPASGVLRAPVLRDLAASIERA